MFISGVNDTGEKREKFWDKIFLNISLRAKDWSFAYFSFLGVGKLILAGLSNRRCRWHCRKIYQRWRWHGWTIFRQCRWHRGYILGFFFFSERYQRHRGNINCSPVSTTPAINFLPVSLTPLNSLSPVSLTPVININSQISLRIFKKIQKGSNGILGGLGDTDSWKKNLKSKISCQTPFKRKDTSHLWHLNKWKTKIWPLSEI